MALVKIKFAPIELMAELFFGSGTPGQVRITRAALNEGRYIESGMFNVNGDSQDAAEDAFDLTNNPARQDEFNSISNAGRSVSVGDVVVVGEEQWLCCAVGWAEL